MRIAVFLILICLLPQAVQAAENCSIKPHVPFYAVDPQGYTNLVQGTDGWLFNAQQDLVSHFDISAENLSLLRQLTEVLRAGGSELVIAYHPLRSMAAIKHVPMNHPLVIERNYDPAKALQSYSDLIKKLNSDEITAVGTPEFKSGEDYFRKFEFHWSPQGAREMAYAVTEAIKRRGWVRQSANKAAPELLENPADIKITLIGTSFTNVPAYQDAIYEFLGGANIWNAAINAGGMDDSLLAYLASPIFRQTLPRVLVWEIPGYFSLGSNEMTVTLRSAIAAVYGNCTPDKTLSDEKVTFGPEPTAIAPMAATEGVADTYLYFKFPRPLDRGASLGYTSATGEVCAQLERPYIPPEHSNFFYLLPDASSALKFHAPAEFYAQSGQIKLCRL